MTRLVAIDIGGTNARFALAEAEHGRVTRLGEPIVFHTAEHASFELAYRAFAERAGVALPPNAAISFAGPVHGDLLKLTNSSWMIRPSGLPASLGLEKITVVNDFGAVAHAVMQADQSDFHAVCGPKRPLPEDGVVTIVGPGTGLGVAHALRRDGRYFVNETEGGHLDFAPLDMIEDGILGSLRTQFRRVSTERLVSGPGLAHIHRALAAIEGVAVEHRTDVDLWTAAQNGSDPLAAAALDRFLLIFGAVAGDLALAQGASAVVLAGGVGLRLAERLPHSGFGQRFIAKWRFERMMADMPVMLITHPQPGLYGAAAAWAQKFAG